jgi:integrase/recombinase XerC
VASSLESGLSLLEITPGTLDAALESVSFIPATDFFNTTKPIESRRRRRSAASLHRIKAAVKAFFNWTDETGLTPDNPARMIRLHRLPRKPPKFLTVAEKVLSHFFN